METYATLMIILLCWAILLVADLVVSGLLRLAAKVPFRKAFRWGLVALLVPPVVIAYGTFVEEQVRGQGTPAGVRRPAGKF